MFVNLSYVYIIACYTTLRGINCISITTQSIYLLLYTSHIIYYIYIFMYLNSGIFPDLLLNFTRYMIWIFFIQRYCIFHYNVFSDTILMTHKYIIVKYSLKKSNNRARKQHRLDNTYIV